LKNEKMKNVKKRKLPIIPFAALNQTTKRNLRSYFVSTQEVFVSNKERFRFLISNWLRELEAQSDWARAPLSQQLFKS